MWLFFAFVAVPLIEIALFIQIGGLIGLWPTLGVIVLTAAIGTVMVRSQGMQTLDKLRRAVETGGDPSRDLAHGAMILFSGLLLLTPGFFTDAVGFALLIPRIRDAIFSRIASELAARSVRVDPAGGGRARHQGPPRTPHQNSVIEGEFEEVDPDTVPDRPGKTPSGWTRR